MILPQGEDEDTVSDEEKGCGPVGLSPQPLRPGRDPRSRSSSPTARLLFRARPRDGGFCLRRGATTAPRGPREVPSQLWGPQLLTPSPGDTPRLPRHCGASGVGWDLTLEHP